jgi:competence protein ComEC
VSALLASGIVASSLMAGLAPGTWFAVSAAGAIAGWATRGRAAVLLLSLSVFAFGGGWFAHRVHTVPEDHLSRFLDETPRLLDVEGMILSTPRRIVAREGRLGAFFPPAPRTVFDLRVERLAGDGASHPLVRGVLWVGVDGAPLPFGAGDRVRILGMARGTPPVMNPGEPDRRRWSRGRGIAGSIDVDAAGAVQPASTPLSGFAVLESRVRGFIARLRSNAHAWLDDPAARADDAAPRALLRALLLGESDRGLADLNEAFTRLGLSHILSISGFNLVVLAATVITALRCLGDRPRLEALLAALIILVYLLMIPARAPVQRAAFMVLTFLAADTAGRRYDRLTILAWAAVVVLVVQPMELFSPGFQLSFGVVAALLTLSDAVRSKMFGKRAAPDTLGLWRGGVERIKDASAASVVAWGVATPLIIYHVGIFSPLGAVATILLIPLVSLIMGAGYVTLVIAIVVPAAGEWAGPALTAASSLLARLVLTIDAAPWTVVHLPSVSLGWTGLATAAVVWWLWPADIEGLSRRANRGRWLCTIAAAVWLAATLLAPRLGPSGAARLDTLSVGDGACHLLRVPGDRWGTDALLFDCGSLRLNMGERTIPAALRALGVWHVPTVIVSHPNIDHYAALLDMLQPLGTRRVIVGEAFVAAGDANPGGPAAFVLRELHRRGVAVVVASEGDSFPLGRCRVEIISPPRGAVWRHPNDASLVVRLRVPVEEDPAGERVVLLTGDIQREAIVSLRQRHAGLAADILEAPHHGSHNDAAEEFIAALHPSAVVQSTGQRRAGDARWDDAKRSLFWRTTAVDGAVSHTIHTNGEITAHRWRRD